MELLLTEETLFICSSNCASKQDSVFTDPMQMTAKKKLYLIDKPIKTNLKDYNIFVIRFFHHREHREKNNKFFARSASVLSVISVVKFFLFYMCSIVKRGSVCSQCQAKRRKFRSPCFAWQESLLLFSMPLSDCCIRGRGELNRHV